MIIIAKSLATALPGLGLFAALSAAAMLSIAWAHCPGGILRELRRKRERNRKNEKDR